MAGRAISMFAAMDYPRDSVFWSNGK